ncbi:hypothetical protein GCM10027290_36600 [Micromonospora sonneratiae]|jgi:hypothetical protein|uniref:Small secreted domain n=1 Tax=Micromonospora sonneratiae TaxID=1184706 RepID=A0ABW3YFC4_9ACTN
MRKAIPLLLAGVVAAAIGLIGSAALAETLTVSPQDAVKKVSPASAETGGSTDTGTQQYPQTYGNR